MSDLTASIDHRTRLAGNNRLELLMFRLNGAQLYGINVFKVREVLKCPSLSTVPQSHPVVLGISNIRGKTISIMDLSLAIGGAAIEYDEEALVIISEFNRSVQGFLVREVDRIVNLNWNDMQPPPVGTAGAGYLTAVANIQQELVEVIDIERVLLEVMGGRQHVSSELQETFEMQGKGEPALVLVVDDSMVAREQVRKIVESDLNMRNVIARDGKQAIEMLKTWADNGDARLHQLAMIISDIEMPAMDGYTFTTRVRADQRLQHLHIILHTSMSGGFNQSIVDSVGANQFIPKFDPDRLAKAIMDAKNAI